MSDINTVTLTGHLGADPKTFTNDQGTIARFSVASTEKFKVGDEWKERTQWTQVAVYDKFKAEYAEKNLHKGSAVLLQGQLETHSYEKEQETRYATEVALRPGKCLLKMLGTKPAEAPAEQPANDAARSGAGRRPGQSAKLQPK